MVTEVIVGPSVNTFSKLQDLIEQIGNVPAKYTFSAGTIIIDVPLKLYDFTELAGAGIGSTVFKLINNAPVTVFANGTPLIGSKYKYGTVGLCLHDFTVNGNYENQKGTGAATAVSGADHGKGYHNIIGIGNIANPTYGNSKDCTFYNLELGYNQGDGIRVEGGQNILAYNIKSAYGGHDVVCFAAVRGGEMYGLDVQQRSNAGARLRSCIGVKIHDCYIDGSLRISYSPGIELQSTAENWIMENIEVYNNCIYRTLGPGIQVACSTSKNGLIHIHHNRIIECGQMPVANRLSGVGGIIADGTDLLIEYNTISGSYGYGIKLGPYDMTSKNNAEATIRYNIIDHTRKSFYAGTASGTGIVDLTNGRYKVTVTGNCQYGNKVGNHHQVTYTDQIAQDPLFADADKHLKSVYGHFARDALSKTVDYVIDDMTSPCIDTVSKAEIGAYYGTLEASKYEPPLDYTTLPSIVLPRGSDDELTTLVEKLKADGYNLDGAYYLNVGSDFKN